MFLGRIVRPGRDPQWTEEDRGYALAWQANKKATCSCGTRHDEWDEDRDAYVPETSYCRGHALLGEHEKSLPKNPDGRPIPGFLTYLRPRTEADDGPDPDDD